MKEKIGPKKLPDEPIEPENLLTQPAREEIKTGRRIIPFGENETDQRDEEIEAPPEITQRELKFIRKRSTSEELAYIRHLSKEERKLPMEDRRQIRRERLEKFKKTLDDQTKGILNTIDDLRGEIYENPNATKEALEWLVDKNAKQHGLKKYPIRSFKRAIIEYVSKHKAIEKYSELYRNDNDLFEACFKVKPKGKVLVVKSPMTLNFQCFDEEDYTNAFNWDRRDQSGNLEPVDMERAKLSGGGALGDVNIKELQGVVIIEKLSNNKITKNGVEVVWNKERSREIQTHEEQHQFNKLFKLAENHTRIRQIMEEAVMHEDPEKTLSFLIHNFVRWERRNVGIDTMARDEILAYYKDGSSADQIYKTLSTSRLYDYKNLDYFKKKIEDISEDLIDYAKSSLTDVVWEYYEEDPEDYRLVVESPLMLDKDEIQKYIDKVFGEEYLADLKKWIEAIKILEKKWYLRGDIVKMLYQEPVNRWLKFAQRKGNDESDWGERVELI